jgi:hypothetical protein
MMVIMLLDSVIKCIFYTLYDGKKWDCKELIPTTTTNDIKNKV